MEDDIRIHRCEKLIFRLFELEAELHINSNIPELSKTIHKTSLRLTLGSAIYQLWTTAMEQKPTPPSLKASVSFQREMFGQIEDKTQVEHLISVELLV